MRVVRVVLVGRFLVVVSICIMGLGGLSLWVLILFVVIGWEFEYEGGVMGVFVGDLVRWVIFIWNLLGLERRYF